MKWLSDGFISGTRAFVGLGATPLGHQTHSDQATATLAALLPKWVPGYDPTAPYLYGVGHDPETVPSGLADAMVDAIASVTDLARDRSVEDVDHWTHKEIVAGSVGGFGR